MIWVRIYSGLIALALVFSVRFMAPAIYGNKMQALNINVFSVLNIMAILGVSSLICWIFKHKENKIKSLMVRKPSSAVLVSRKRVFLSSFMVNMICWMIWFMLFYPGTGMNDTINCLMSYQDALQPWMYQLYIYYGFRFFLWITENAILSYGAMIFLQMLILSTAIAWVVSWLACKGIDKKIIYGVTIYYAVSPVIGNYSITLVKDVIFSIGVLVLVPLLYDLLESEGKILTERRYRLMLLLTLLNITLLRSNGKIIVVLTFVIIWIKSSIKNKKDLLKILCLVVLINSVIGFVGNRTIGRDVKFREAISVPLIQIGAVLNTDGQIKDADKAILEEILPLEIWKEKYNFSFVDTIKFNSEFNNDYLNQHKADFIGVWFRILKDNFQTYVKSYMCHTYGYWNLSPFNVLSTDMTQSYFTRINNNTRDDSFWGQYIDRIGLRNPNRLPEEISEKINLGLKKVFRLNLLLSPGGMFWILLGCLALTLQWKIKNIGFVYLPVLLNWLTLMIAAPASFIYRYSFYLILTSPVLILLVLLKCSQQFREMQ